MCALNYSILFDQYEGELITEGAYYYYMYDRSSTLGSTGIAIKRLYQ